MKIRNGFVSNSSSSSFIIHKAAVGEEAFNNILEACKKAFAEDKATFDDVEEKYQTFIEHVYGDLEILDKTSFDSRKDAAEYINNNCILPAICFNHLDGKLYNTSVEKWMENMPDDKLLQRIYKC